MEYSIKNADEFKNEPFTPEKPYYEKEENNLVFQNINLANNISEPNNTKRCRCCLELKKHDIVFLIGLFCLFVLILLEIIFSLALKYKINIGIIIYYVVFALYIISCLNIIFGPEIKNNKESGEAIMYFIIFFIVAICLGIIFILFYDYNSNLPNYEDIYKEDDYKSDTITSSNHVWNILDTIKMIKLVITFLSGVFCFIFYVSKYCK
jgi:hypothetical protein